MTTAAAIARPESNEYLSYYDRYVTLVPEGDILATLAKQMEGTLQLLRGIDEVKAAQRYAPGKWSIKELVGHLIDTERIFSYRALRFARNDTSPLTGFEQDDYVRAANFDDRALAQLTDEFEYVRLSTIKLFESLSAEAWNRRGPANGDEVSVRALAFIIAGHELHHMNVLKTRYLQSESSA
jgi:hypothetical protein